MWGRSEMEERGNTSGTSNSRKKTMPMPLASSVVQSSKMLYARSLLARTCVCLADRNRSSNAGFR